MRRLIDDFLALTGIGRLQVIWLSVGALASGALNVALVSMVGEALRHASPAELMPRLGLFVAGTVLYLLTLAHLQTRVVRSSEQAAVAIRRRFAEALVRAPLLDLEQLAHHKKQAVFGRDAGIVAAALPSLVAVIASAATVLGGLGYLFALSPRAAAVVCAVIAGAVALYQVRLNRLLGPLGRAYGLNDSFFRFSEDLLHGAKELKLDSRWSARFMREDLLAVLDQSSAAVADVKVRQQNVGLVSAVAFFVLIGMAAFLHRLYGGFDTAIATSFVLTLLFLNMPVQSAVMRMPVLGEAAVALRRIGQTLERLAREPDAAPGTSAAMPVDGWQRLQLERIEFRYPAAAGAQGFGLRDIDLEVHRGDLVFMVGGNGSGKTTLAKVVMGLYVPCGGAILLDGRPVETAAQPYRDQFNAVYSDAHLFSRRPESADDAARERFDALAAELKLTPTLDADGRLDTRSLSQGQRKRLALAFALSEDKPIHFFDEWTADQDPEFRLYFYETFLPRLRSAGKTVFVISHDERFHHGADLLVELESGRIRSARRRLRDPAAPVRIAGTAGA